MSGFPAAFAGRCGCGPGCLERRDKVTGECMALKLGREYLAELAERAAKMQAEREARTGGQLDLFGLLDTGQGCPGNCPGRCRCDDGWDEPEDDGPPWIVDAPDISTWGQP